MQSVKLGASWIGIKQGSTIGRIMWPSQKNLIACPDKNSGGYVTDRFKEIAW